MENNPIIDNETPKKVPQTPGGPEQSAAKQTEEEKKECKTMAHVATKVLGMKHGCEADEKKSEAEEEKKDDKSEVPEVQNMQKFAKAGKNEDLNAPSQAEKKPDEKIPEPSKEEKTEKSSE